eukprot:CAMPEP_0197022736 /NCGR_PEP_ID=MMETSP1384-20130603/3551_1 /TAXON_ID=29189 /ORGANISM="Ammonia sp." /LENGTH=303 /DNA_ID=CAMNT_0042450827 /DNA_START=8 /DNA_END=919 /DNA_ORIENTATION=-
MAEDAPCSFSDFISQELHKELEDEKTDETEMEKFKRLTDIADAYARKKPWQQDRGPGRYMVTFGMYVVVNKRYNFETDKLFRHYPEFEPELGDCPTKARMQYVALMVMSQPYCPLARQYDIWHDSLSDLQDAKDDYLKNIGIEFAKRVAPEQEAKQQKQASQRRYEQQQRQIKQKEQEEQAKRKKQEEEGEEEEEEVRTFNGKYPAYVCRYCRPGGGRNIDCQRHFGTEIRRNIGHGVNDYGWPMFVCEKHWFGHKVCCLCKKKASGVAIARVGCYKCSKHIYNEQRYCRIQAFGNQHRCPEK